MYKALTLPLLVTLFFHGLILAVILIGAPESQPLVKRAATQYIKAELVTLKKAKVKQAAKPKQTAKVKIDGSKLKQQKKREAEKKAQLKAQQQAKQAKLKRDQAIKEQQKKEQVEKQQRLAEQQRRLREQTERELADAIEQENTLALAESDAQIVSSYVDLIGDVIMGNWNRPPSARNNMEAVLVLTLVPTGEVIGVKVVKSSGNTAFDRAAEKAVLKAERFPELQQLPARVFENNFRRLILIFNPEDLRL